MTWSCSSRWHDYFRKMTTGLPRLQHFGLGHGPWGDDIGEDNTAWAFEASASLWAQLEAGRYVIFHWGTGPSQWIEPDAVGDALFSRVKITLLNEQYLCCWETDDDPPLPLYPDCWDRDQEAFDVLVAAMEARRARKQGV